MLICFHLPTDKAKVSNCRVIVHCLAGISRSATIAIAYIMKTMGLSSDDAYRYACSSYSLSSLLVKMAAHCCHAENSS